jgi:hypothetical protein
MAAAEATSCLAAGEGSLQGGKGGDRSSFTTRDGFAKAAATREFLGDFSRAQGRQDTCRH